MQLIESSAFGVRSARIELNSPDGKRSITLFPMIHVGEPEFYRRVYEDAFAHDVAVVEGVNSPIGHRITRSYRWLASSPRLQLAVQTRYPAADTVKARIVHADLSAEEFAHAWRRIPIGLRALIEVGAPLAGLYWRATLSREALARRLSLDDLPGRSEILRWDPETAFLDNALLVMRDQRLIEHLGRLLIETDVSRISVVYGARHMRALLAEFVAKRGFRIGECDWMDLFSI